MENSKKNQGKSKKIIFLVLNNKEKIYNKIVFITLFILSIILGASILKIGSKYDVTQTISTTYLIISILTSILTIFIIIINIKIYKKEIAKLFLTFVIPIGILYCILIPPNCTQDEEAHIHRAYDIAKGNIITPFGEENRGDIYVPKQLLDVVMNKTQGYNYAKIDELLHLPANYEEETVVQTTTKTYAPVSYFSNAIIFLIGKILNLNLMLVLYLAKIFNFIIFLIIGYFSIKIIPFGKLTLAIYMFLPMFLQQASSISADWFLNNMSILFIAYTLKLAYQTQDLKLGQRLFYYISIFVISLSKFIYFPLVFISLLLIKNKNINKKNKLKIIIISIAIAIISSASWFLFTQKYAELRQYILEANVKPVEQVKFMLQNPGDFLSIFNNTIQDKGLYYILTFGGSELGYANIDIPEIVVFIMLILLVLTPLIEKNKVSLEKSQKIIMILLFLGLAFLVMIGLYLTWSPVGNDFIAGVQGRYFIPVIILLLLTMINKENHNNYQNIEVIYMIVFFILNILPLIKIIDKF